MQRCPSKSSGCIFLNFGLTWYAVQKERQNVLGFLFFFFSLFQTERFNMSWGYRFWVKLGEVEIFYSSALQSQSLLQLEQNRWGIWRKLTPHPGGQMWLVSDECTWVGWKVKRLWNSCQVRAVRNGPLAAFYISPHHSSWTVPLISSPPLTCVFSPPCRL